MTDKRSWKEKGFDFGEEEVPIPSEEDPSEEMESPSPVLRGPLSSRLNLQPPPLQRTPPTNWQPPVDEGPSGDGAFLRRLGGLKSKTILVFLAWLMAGVWVPSFIGAMLPEGWEKGAAWWSGPASFTMTLFSIISPIIGGWLLMNSRD